MHNKVLHKTETSQVFKLKVKIKHKSSDKMITGKELHLNQSYRCKRHDYAKATHQNKQITKTQITLHSFYLPLRINTLGNAGNYSRNNSFYGYTDTNTKL